MLYRVLADLVVVVHAAYIAFVLFGLLAVVSGAALGWGWVRHFWFRAIHLAMIAVVVIQAIAGVICPLTILENYLRIRGGARPYPGSFIGYWVHELIFYDAKPWVFAVCYTIFGLIVVAVLFLVPPRWPWRRKGGSGKG
jgi:hypothetical protein